MSMKVSMFWQGELSLYEKACMASFLHRGFQLEVWTFDRGLEVPEGTVLRDAAELMPQEGSLGLGGWDPASSLTVFSEIFRLKLLNGQGGLWMDADMFCLRPVGDFAALRDQHPVTTLFARQDDEIVNGAMILAPPGSPAIAELLARAETQRHELTDWGQLGPHLVSAYTQDGPEAVRILPESSFYPLHYVEFALALLPEAADFCRQRSHSSYCVHLWNRFYRHICLPKNILPPKGSYLHALFSEVLPPGPCLPFDTLQRLLEGTRAMEQVRKAHSQ